jgi:hypothetical protein
VLGSVDKLRAEKRENALNHLFVAVLLFVIVGSTINLLLANVFTVLLHMGSGTWVFPSSLDVNRSGNQFRSDASPYVELILAYGEPPIPPEAAYKAFSRFTVV